MILLFLSESRSVESVTVNYFEPHHGQNEGDSIHSYVERAMKKHMEIRLPCQLATIIRSGRKQPIHVTEVATSDILD